MNRLSVDLAVQHVPDVRDPFRIAPPYVTLMEFDSAGDGLEDLIEHALGEAMDDGLLIDAVMARSEAAAQAFWKLRESLPAGHRKEGAQANHDVSTPVSQVATFLDRAATLVERLCPGARIVAFGHAGDGNIHYSAIQPKTMPAQNFPAAMINDAVHELAVSLGGSISAEHGIGVSRKPDFARFKPPVQIALMRTIKTALDPKGVMNPRVLFG
jgi:FAD/FMN-containing dehydrogenase